MFSNAELMSYSFFDSKLNKDVYVRPTDGADIPEYDGPFRIKKISGKGILVTRIYDGGDKIVFVNLDPFNITKVEVVYNSYVYRILSKPCDVTDERPAWKLTGKLEDPLEDSITEDETEESVNASRLDVGELTLKPGGYHILHYRSFKSAPINETVD